MPLAPPRPKPLPLNGLRALEAAARLGGFSQAAEELGVSAGAVSQHIKQLEERLGYALFERAAHGVHLTPELRQCLAGLSQGFDHLNATMRTLQDARPQTALHIAAMPAVAQILLAPLLGGQTAQDPQDPANDPRAPAAPCPTPPLPALSVTAMETRPNPDRSLFDIALFIDTPTGRAGETILSGDAIFPVCSPALAAEISSPADLMGHTWIYDQFWQDDWRLWCTHVAPEIRPISGPAYSLYSLALAAARGGGGVLMGHEALVGPDLRAGRLVRALPRESAPKTKPDATATCGRFLVMERAVASAAPVQSDPAKPGPAQSDTAIHGFLTAFMAL